MRYKLLKMLDKLLRRKVERCRTCGKRLTEEQIYFYDVNCEKCEQKYMEV